MYYPVTEVFHSIQTEGPYAGHPATFIRLAGCNLRCNFCDTDHIELFSATENELADQVSHSLVVITGGEPALHNLEPLVTQLLDCRGVDCVQIETNGSQVWQECFDRCTVVCSPKSADPQIVLLCDAVKLVVDTTDTAESVLRYWRGLSTSGWEGVLYLQPRMDGPDQEKNIAHTVNLCLTCELPLSLQFHKLINIP